MCADCCYCPTFRLYPERVTFIIDSKGIIRDTENSSINMKAHSKLVEKWVPILKKESQSAAPTGATTPAATATTGSASDPAGPATTTSAAPPAPATAATPSS